MKRDKDNDISFLGKVILFFRLHDEKYKFTRLPQKIVNKQKDLAGYEPGETVVEAKLSFGFSMAKVFAISVLCIFLAVVLLFGSSIMSYENVYYMFKDISYISTFSETRPETLGYSRSVGNQAFASFKNGLAVAGDSEIKLFASTGRVTMSAGSEYTNPQICTSDSYILIYDQGSCSFSIYNSFICVYSETLDYPISSASMANDGSFLIVTKSATYRSAVRIYNKKFKLETEYLKNDLVISAELSSNGKYAAIASLDTEGGEAKVTISVLERGKKNLKSSTMITDSSMPYLLTFLSGNRIALVCSEGLSVYDLNGNRKNTFLYPYKLSRVAHTSGGIALLFDERDAGANELLVAFDDNGDMKVTVKISGSVSDMKMNKDNIFLLCDGQIIKVDSTFGHTSTEKFFEEGARIVLTASGELIACTSSLAYYLTFD